MFLKNIKIKKTLKLRVLGSRILHLERRDSHLSWGPCYFAHGPYSWRPRLAHTDGAGHTFIRLKSCGTLYWADLRLRRKEGLAAATR